MCSIIGCRWEMAAIVLVKGLKRMEYRGYDSVGVATAFDGSMSIRKGTGKVAEVNAKENLDQMWGNVGIGHTRWATHGPVSTRNAHPHLDTICQSVAIVHNGIIENYQSIKESLGCEFVSDTDSEVIANLLGFYYKETGDVKESMIRAIARLEGSFAFIALFSDGTLAAARNHEPLILGIGDLGYFLSSDVLGFIEYADEAIYLDNQEFIIIGQEPSFFDFNGNPVSHAKVQLSRELADVYKDDYAHFTLKEINEQPKTILRAGRDSEGQLSLVSEFIKHAKHLYLTGSGTSYNAALIGKHLLNKYAKVKAEPIISSESQFLGNDFDAQSILLALSQSGESADVIDTVMLAKRHDAKIISILNTLTSSLAGLSSLTIGLGCGPEIGVAATKSFTSQLMILLEIVGRIVRMPVVSEREQISAAMQQMLDESVIAEGIAAMFKDINDVYVLGRGIHYPIAMEASLKLKELAYIHAEGLPGGELKHGPLALMDNKSYVILINPTDDTHGPTLTSAQQIKSRGGRIIGISDEDNPLYDHWIALPKMKNLDYPLIEIIPIQLLSYYIALVKDADPDYPRNLAKSCTVR